MQTTVNGHSKNQQVPVNPTVPAQDNTQAVLELLASMQTQQAQLQAQIAELKAQPAQKPAKSSSKEPSEKRIVWKPYATPESFKGNPTLTLFAHAKDKPFSFGLKKAKLIIALLPAIKAFVEKNDDGSFAF